MAEKGTKAIDSLGEWDKLCKNIETYVKLAAGSFTKGTFKTILNWRVFPILQVS